MKQVLFISAGKTFPAGAFAFMSSFKQLDIFHVKGLFFSPLDFEGRITASYVPGSNAIDETRREEHAAVKQHKERFASSMDELGLPYSIHENNEPWDKSVFIKETRFADLVIISGEAFYAELDASQPNLFLHEALRETESPIMVMPESYTPISKLFFAYDGSKESVHAFKQFTYLCPHMLSLPAEVLYAKEEESDDAPDREFLGVYAQLHYPHITFSKLHFKATELFPTWIGDQQGVMLITGSYGRSSLSYAAKKSFAEKVIAEHKIPLFITHY